MAILIGCSGWSYDDWVGRFYPLKLAKKKGEWFSYYAKHFQTVEINSTFYHPPGELQVQSWIKKARKREGFEYSLKVPQLVTHKALVEGNGEKAVFWTRSFEKTCAGPLAEVGCLGGVLLQLSPYFKNDGSALRNLLDLLDAVSRDEYDYAVEFRHISWLGRHRGKGREEGDAAGDRIGGAPKSENAANAAGRKGIDAAVLGLCESGMSPMSWSMVPACTKACIRRRIMLTYASTAETTISGTRARKRPTTGGTDTITTTRKSNWNHGQRASKKRN